MGHRRRTYRECKPWPTGWARSMDELHMRHSSQADSYILVTDAHTVAFGSYLRDLIKEAKIDVVLLGAITDINPARLYDIINFRQPKHGWPESITLAELLRLSSVFNMSHAEWKVRPNGFNTRI